MNTCVWCRLLQAAQQHGLLPWQFGTQRRNAAHSLYHTVLCCTVLCCTVQAADSEWCRRRQDVCVCVCDTPDTGALL